MEKIGMVEARRVLIQRFMEMTPAVGLPVFWENRGGVELDKVGPSFVEVILDFNGAEAASLGNLASNVGMVVFALYTREGAGTLTELEVADRLDAWMSRKSLANVQTGVLTPGRKSPTQQGWRRVEWLIPFTFFS